MVDISLLRVQETLLASIRYSIDGAVGGCLRETIAGKLCVTV